MRLTEDDSKAINVLINGNWEQLETDQAFDEIMAMENLAWKITAQKIVDRAWREGKLSHICYKN